MIAPVPVMLEGYGVRLEPMTAGHQDALVAAAADGDVWKLWYVSVADLVAERASAYMDAALLGQARGDMLPWVVRELGTNTIVGSTRYHDIVPAIDRVEIGFTFYARAWQRTHVNTACKLLLLTHAFETWGCNRVELLTDERNTKSRQAILRLGATEEGLLRSHMVMRDGFVRNSVIFSITRAEWPQVKAGLLEKMELRA